MIGEQYWIEIPAIFGLAILLGVISFTGKPNLWGRWESFTFFHAFAPAKFKYKLTIGGQGYLTLECARWVCDRFGWSFRNARLPVIVAGWISLVFLFMTCQLWFGFWPALIVTAFCGVNRLFFLFQHQLIVAMPTYTSIMGIVYFISAAHYDGNIFYVWNAVGMGLFLCGCLAHYGPGRLTGIALWTYSLIGSIALHRISFSIGYLPVASLIISLLFFMPGGAMNFKTLFNKHYIFPPGTDVTFSSKSLSATILLNLKIIGEFISPIRSKRFSWSFMYGSYSAYVHSFTWLHLVLLALGACVFWFSVNCYIIGVFTLLFLSLLIPCACLQLFDTRISGARIINGSGYIGAPRLFPIRWDNLNMNNITETTNLIVRPERDDCQNLFIASHVIEQECVQLTFPDIVSETLS